MLAGLQQLRFVNYLDSLAEEIRVARSGRKTKLRLLAAAARLLEEVGYRDLNVEGVSSAAGMAKGTFYIHFETKDEFLRELAKQYSAFEKYLVPAAVAGEEIFGALVRWIDWYEGTFARNVGILRCIVQMGEADSEMRVIWHARNQYLSESIIKYLALTLGRKLASRKHMLFTVRTVGGMLDQSLLNQFQVLVGTGYSQPFKDEQLTRLHALLVFRALFGEDPPEESARDVLAILPSLR